MFTPEANVAEVRYRAQYTIRFTIVNAGGSLLAAVLKSLSCLLKNSVVLDVDDSRRAVIPQFTEWTVDSHVLIGDRLIHFPTLPESQLGLVITKATSGDTVVY